MNWVVVAREDFPIRFFVVSVLAHERLANGQSRWIVEAPGHLGLLLRDAMEVTAVEPVAEPEGVGQAGA